MYCTRRVQLSLRNSPLKDSIVRDNCRQQNCCLPANKKKASQGSGGVESGEQEAAKGTVLWRGTEEQDDRQAEDEQDLKATTLDRSQFWDALFVS